MSLLNSCLPAFARANSCATEDNATALSARPVYQVKETADAWLLTVQLPGVTKENLSITDEDGILTVQGERAWKQPTGWTALHRESAELPFALRLSHDNEFDSEKAKAELKDGVLQLSLPKAESRKARKITVA